MNPAMSGLHGPVPGPCNPRDPILIMLLCVDNIIVLNSFIAVHISVFKYLGVTRPTAFRSYMFLSVLIFLQLWYEHL